MLSNHCDDEEDLYSNKYRNRLLALHEIMRNALM